LFKELFKYFLNKQVIKTTKGNNAIVPLKKKVNLAEGIPPLFAN